MQPDNEAREVIRDQQTLESDRAVFDTHFRETAERVLPRQNDFQQEQTPGAKRTEKVFDSTAILALDKFASAVDSLITPSTQMWHGLAPDDPDLLEDKDTMVYCAELTKMLFRLRYRPSANFQSQAHECYISLGAFGNLGMFIDDMPGIGYRYKSIALAELYFQENYGGIIDLSHRKFPMTNRQALQKFKDKAPERVQKDASLKPFEKSDYLHRVCPNEDMHSKRSDYRGMPIYSCYVDMKSQSIISRGGFNTMPYSISRHVTAPKETYGRGPAMMVLPDIKMVNEMEKTTIRAAHKMVDPPLLALGDGILTAFNARPNAINYGGIDASGNQLVKPLETGGKLPIVKEMMDEKRKLINDAFLVTLFQILVENPQMTATEALLRAQEKGQLLSPTMGRQQSEFLGPMIRREVSIAAHAGILKDMPKRLRDRGGVLKVSYTSPLDRLRRAEDGVAILRTIDALAPLAKINPEVLDVLDTDAAARELSEINGAPIRIIRSPDEIAVIREGRKQSQQTAEVLANVDTAANAAKNLGQAQQAAGFTQPAIPAAPPQ